MVGIIFIGDLYVCPYLHRYTDECDANNIQYEFLFWNRSGEKLDLPENYIYFDMQSDEEQFFATKAIDFLKYRHWLKKQLKEKKYQKLIILSTLSGIILCDVLKKYKSKYIFDIRDYSYERIKPFYLIEQKIIENSAYTAISSPGFKSFLPNYDYVIIHNMQRNESVIRGDFKKKPYGSSLNIVWNGTMRYFNHQKRIIESLANDDRFVVYYHGTGPELEQYKNFVNANNIKNVFFTGRYDNSQKRELLKDADILNNSYWIDNENEVLYAVSNRYYDGLIYRIPQLVEANTYKTSICEENKIGIGLDPRNNNFADLLYEWYFSVNEHLFGERCESLLVDAIKDDENATSKLRSFILEWENIQ